MTELGLTEYESRCFVSLARVSKGTAKDVSELSEVPRPRVYRGGPREAERGAEEAIENMEDEGPQRTEDEDE